MGSGKSQKARVQVSVMPQAGGPSTHMEGARPGEEGATEGRYRKRQGNGGRGTGVRSINTGEGRILNLFPSVEPPPFLARPRLLSWNPDVISQSVGIKVLYSLATLQLTTF